MYALLYSCCMMRPYIKGDVVNMLYINQSVTTVGALDS